MELYSELCLGDVTVKLEILFFYQTACRTIQFPEFNPDYGVRTRYSVAMVDVTQEME